MTSKIILLFLFVLSLGIDIAKHGETKEISAITSITSFSIIMFLLWMSNFFEC